jgi:DNA-binding transcriptional ArsR family regulator
MVRMRPVSDERCDLLCLSLPRAEKLRARRITGEWAARAAARAQALGDPTRFTIAVVLAEGGELCVCDLAWICERSQNLVSHHLRSLRAADLVTSRRDKKMVMYSLTSQGRDLVAALLAAREEVAP